MQELLIQFFYEVRYGDSIAAYDLLRQLLRARNDEEFKKLDIDAAAKISQNMIDRLKS